MGAVKFTDDIPSLKFRDDRPTLKFIDDGGGPTLKFYDDGGGHTRFKFIDDQPTIKQADDPSVKGFDDVKYGAYDTLVETLAENMTFAENIDPSQWWGVDPAIQGNQPFVLANPHHSMEWTKTFGDPNDPQVQLQQYEGHMAQLDQTKQQLSEQLKQLEEYRSKISKEMEELKASAKKTGK